jgi:transposase-like protein
MKQEIKTITHGIGFTIQQSRMIVERFIWNCPYCASPNKTLEFGVRDNRLICDSCHEVTKYSFEAKEAIAKHGGRRTSKINSYGK